MVPDHIHNLQNLLGEASVLVDKADTQAYEQGARYDAGTAAFVMRPSSTDQVSKAVAYCVNHNIYFIIQSGNTGLVSASTPDGSGKTAVLSLDKLNQIDAPDIENRTVCVGAGVRLSALNESLADNGFFYPIDLGADPMIGGMVATNTGGTRFVRYGDVRQNLLGLKVVLANETGTVLDFTQPIRKNNTGPDWQQMFVGTAGAFGIVTECVVNIVAKPKQVEAVLLVPSSFEMVNILLKEMEARFGSCFTAFEGMSKNAMAAAFSHVPSLKNPFPSGEIPDYAILAEVSRDWAWTEGEQPLNEMLENVLALVCESEQAPLADAYMGRADNLWAIRHALSEGVKNLGQLIAFDVSFRRGDVMRFTAYMQEELPKQFAGLTICDFGHIGDGGLHFNLVVPTGDPVLTSREFENTLRDWVYDVAVNKFNGSYSAEHGVGPKNQKYYDRYTPEAVKLLARNFKNNTSNFHTSAARFWPK